MASLVRCSTWEISSLFFPSRSLLFFPCALPSLCSGEITCVSYFQQFHCCQHAEISESSEEEWWDLSRAHSERGKRGEGCETFFLLPSFFFLHHLSGFYFALALGVLINVLPLPFLAFEYYEPNITITAHYPRSYKTKAIAMTKWLLCGCGPFFGSFVLLMERAVILFIHFYYESHTNTHTHIRTYSHSPSPKTKRRFINLLFLWITYFCLCVEKQFPPVQHRLPLGKVGSCQC